MLWVLIRDFFVQNIFGGLLSNGEYIYNNIIGENTAGDLLSTNNVFINLPFYDSTEGYEYTAITLGDYLSNIATIISISLILVLCCLFIYKIIKLVGGLIR